MQKILYIGKKGIFSVANLDVMYSSKTDQWATPMDFFRELDQEFHFNLDPCADDQNHKCEKYFTKEEMFHGEPAENMLKRRYLDPFECFILNLYLNKVKITMDTEKIDTDDNMYECY